MAHMSQVSSGGIKQENKGKKNQKGKRANFLHKKKKKKSGGGMGERRREREKGKKKNIFSLLSKIYGNRTVGFCRNKRQSRSTHKELRVGTKILEFCQTPQGKEFSYLGYF